MVMAAQVSISSLSTRAYSIWLPRLSDPKFLLVSCIKRQHFGHMGSISPCLSLWLMVPSAMSSRRNWALSSATDDSGTEPTTESNIDNTTRLSRTIQAFRIRLTARVNQLRKGLPLKVFFFLVGFYCATAFATVIGQTGDWDILSAGLAVFVVEGIGALMYRVSLSYMGKIKNIITVLNYWKAGLSLGLFLDAFKY